MKEKLQTITARNGFPVFPSAVLDASDKQRPPVRSIVIGEDGEVTIHAEGDTLAALKAAVKSVAPDAKFADRQKTKTTKPKEPADAVAKKNPNSRR